MINYITMRKKDDRPEHVKEFVGKYEDQNPISQYLVNNFYKNLNQLIPREPLEVLEVGCGAGLSAERIIPMLPVGSTFAGSDLLSDLTDLASQRNPGISFTTESAYDLQHENNSFDLVFGLEMLEHLDEPKKALTEMARVSRKYLLLSVPREPIWRMLNMARFKYLSYLGNTPGHLNHSSTRGFEKFVSSVGTVKAVRTPLPWTQVLIELNK